MDNIQAASDGKHKLLIAADTGDVNDTKALTIMVKKAQNNIVNVEDVLADKGYHSGRELKKVKFSESKPIFRLKNQAPRKQILILQCTALSIIKMMIHTHVQQNKASRPMSYHIIKTKKW